MWGAALHDRATGIHRPLEATVIWLEPLERHLGEAQLIASLDHCILDSEEILRIRQAIASACKIPVNNIQVTLTHTHGSGWMSRTRAELPGGELIGPYLNELLVRLTQTAAKARSKRTPACFVFAKGRCNLAAHRDYWDQSQQRFVCGFNPTGPADDTLIIGSAISDTGTRLATVINYACHPTTLAWDNTLLSPDWVGAMRQVVEAAWGGICLFVQGASGDLGPRDGFVGDTEVADRNGRQVGYAALAVLESLPPPGTNYVYSGSVTSGTEIGTWQHRPCSSDEQTRHSNWSWESITVDLPYRHNLPTLELATAEQAQWLRKERQAIKSGDEQAMRNCRAEVEQRTRLVARLSALVEGPVYPLSARIGSLGDALWISVPGELYQVFQIALRERFAPRPVIVSTLTNDWQPGYIPPASVYGYEIYQEVIAATSAGCSELLVESIARAVNR